MKPALKAIAFSLLVLGCLFLGRGVSLAQDSAGQAVFDELTHDFGDIKEVDGPVSHTFRFTNKSRKPYIIDFVSVSCGCTTPEYDKAPVMPGKTGTITITYDPSGRPGMLNKSVVVTSNDRKDRTVLTITGNVEGRPRSAEESYPYELAAGVRAEKNIYLFGYLARGRNATQAVGLYNNGDSPAEITISSESNLGKGFYSVSAAPSIIPPKGKGQLMFTYDLRESDIWGMVQTTLRLSVNGRPAAENISAYATVTEDFSALTKEQLDKAPVAEIAQQFYHLGDISSGDVVRKDFEIMNSGGDVLIIRDLRANGSRIKASADKVEIARGDRATISLWLQPGGKKGRLSESVTLILNDPARPMRELRLAATSN